MPGNYDANIKKPTLGADLPHIARYMLARGFIKKGEKVIDAACGYGYGSKLISEVAEVHGYDIDKGVIDIAKERYPDIKFTCVDLHKAKFGKTDTIVSLETIEHLEKPKMVIDKFKKTAKKIIVSVPVIPTVDKNPFHKHDFTENSIRELFSDWYEFHSFKQGNYFIGVFCEDSSFRPLCL